MAMFDGLVKYLEKRKETKTIKEMKAAIFSVITMKVGDIMTKNVVTVKAEEPITNIINTMVRKNISCVVVEKNGQPQGLVTERDLLKKLPLDQKIVNKTTAKEIMGDRAICATPDTTIFEATEVLVKNHFRKLPVINNMTDRKLVGIITQTDLVNTYDIFQTKIQLETRDLLKIRFIMTKEIVTVKKDTMFIEARQIMKEKNIGSIMLKDDTSISGIFTEKNFLEQVSLNIDRLNNLKIQTIMVYPVVTIDPELNMFEANNLMISRNFRRLPVQMDKIAIGIVTQTDILRAIHDFISTTMMKIDKGMVESANEEDISKLPDTPTMLFSDATMEQIIFDAEDEDSHNIQKIKEDKKNK